METTQPRGSWREYLAACRSMSERDRRNARSANWYLLFWAATMLAAMFGLDRRLIPAGPASVAAVVVPTFAAIAALIAYMRFLRQADELHRKVQLEALALGFGGGFVASFTLELIEQAGWASFDAGDPFLVMIFFFMVGMYLGTRRYA
jgi:hypothetical protein